MTKTTPTREGPTRVLHVCRRYHPLTGGTERYVRDLAYAQAARGFDVRVITLCRDVAGTTREHLEHEDLDGPVRVTRLPGWGSARIAQTLRPDLALRAMWGAAVIHLHDLRFAFIEAVLTTALRGIPLLVHTHGLLFHTPQLQRLKDLAIRYYFAPLLGHTRSVILAGSEADRTHLLARAPSLAHRVRPFPNAIDLSPLIRVSPRRGSGVILVHGRVASSKRIDRAINALGLLDRRDVHLWIAGTPEPGETERLQKVASSSGVANRVLFLGPYEDHELPRLLEGTDLALFPSPGEGFGLALLEALAAGIPCVANDIPAHREVLGPKLAFLAVDFENPRAVAAAINELLTMADDAWFALSEAIRARARSFDLTARLDSLEAIYHELDITVPIALHRVR